MRVKAAQNAGPLITTTLAGTITTIDTLWAVEAAWWGQFKSVRGEEIAPRADWFDDQDDDPTNQKPYIVQDGVAMLSLCGVMTKRSYWWTSNVSTSRLRSLLELCLQDPDVRAILLVIDSPGGQVAGTSDLAADIARVGTVKPLATFFEDQGCSAALWAGTQAPDGVYCNLTATVGSLGTIMEMANFSEGYAWQGVHTDQFTTGKYKGAGSPMVPMTDEWRAYFLDYVAAVNASFVASVQTARKIPDAKMKEIREAGVYVGQQAVAMGLVDGVSTIDAVAATLRRKASARVGVQTRTSRAEADLAPLSVSGESEQASPPASAPCPDLSASAAAAPEADPPSSAAASPQASGETLPTSASAPVGKPTVAETLPPQHQSMPTHAGRGASTSMKTFKELLINTLSAMGLSKMAVAVVGVTSEDDVQAMVQVMSQKVNEEVNDRIAKHELVQGCLAAGIDSAAELGRVLEMKALGQRAFEDLKGDARTQAIRLHGPENGVRVAAQLVGMDYTTVKVMRDSWQVEADLKFGIGENGQPAERASAPKVLSESVSAEGAPAPEAKSAWERLTPAQQKQANMIGVKPENRETFAATFLASKENAKNAA